MISEEEIIEIGQYNKPHGIKGEISATLLCEAEDVAGFSTLISCMDGIYVPFFVNSFRPKNDHTVLLQLCGVASEKDAKRFVNKSIYALRKELPEAGDSVYCDYFIGFEIVDGEGRGIGHITDVDDSTENALFVVRDGNGKEFYVPIAEELISEIKEEGIIVMDLPEGILDL